jgi:hypothetical protein
MCASRVSSQEVKVYSMAREGALQNIAPGSAAMALT